MIFEYSDKFLEFVNIFAICVIFLQIISAGEYVRSVMIEVHMLINNCVDYYNWIYDFMQKHEAKLQS